MTARASVYRDQAGEYRWRLAGANGEIVATGEGHTRAADARRAYAGVERAVLAAIRARTIAIPEDE